MSNKQIDIQGQEARDIVDITQLINPFPGLRPFGIEESHLFFGREGQSDEILVKLSDNKFVAILGTSGSGKSSLMYCGLIPTLYGGFMTQAGSNWKIAVTRPGGGPIDNLAEALLIKDREYSSLGDEDKLIRKTIMSTVLRSSSLGLVEVVRQLKTADHENILILVDQFEELFRYRKLEADTSDLDESSAFVNLLLEAIHQHDEPIYIALTMRSDFIGECAQFPDLTQMINDSHYLIPQMTRDQKRTAIEGPVAVGGGKIAPRLIQQLLNDVGDNPDQLPILQHTLMRTWSYWTDNRKEGEPIDLRHYNAVGTLREALSQHANEAYDSLTKREKEICEVMFKALTEKSSDSQGIRRPTKLSTIAAITGVNEDEVGRVVERFREPGRSLLMPPSGVMLESDTVVDISHESLMRIWIRLKRWLDEESKAAEMYLKLSEASERYQEGRAGLWQMPDLQLALNWRDENKPTLVWGQRYNPAFERTMVFLETSEKAYLTEQRNKEILQKKQVKRMRLTAVILAIATLITLTLVIFAFIKANDATKALKEAEKQKLEAEKQKAEAEAFSDLAQTRAAEAQKASTEAAEQRDAALAATKRAETSLALARQREQEANEARRQAQEQQKAAERAKEEADKQREAADAERLKAEEATKRAERLRYQSLAQSMAIKASNILPEDTAQAELRGLVARQAYLFYEEYKDEGKDYNGDIYAGVYSALQGIYEVKYGTATPLVGDSALNQYRVPLTPEAKQAKGTRSVAYSNDGNSMFSANSDGEVIKWDVETRDYEVIFQNDNVSRVVNISPDEKYLALGTDEDNILLFNIKDIEADPIRIGGHEGGTVFDLVFLPDNSGFISVGEDNRILKSDFKTSQELARSKVRINKIALSSDAVTLAGGGRDGHVYLWNLSRIEEKPSKLIKTEDNEGTESSGNLRRKKRRPSIRSVRFSPDGKFLAYGSEDGAIVLWNLEKDEQEQPTLAGFRAPVTDIEFSPDNRLIIGTSTNRQIRIWDTRNLYDLPIVLRDYKAPGFEKGWVYDADFSPDGKFFVTAAADGNIRRYPAKVDKMAAEICSHITLGNMSPNEWIQYVGVEIPYEKTCNIDKQRKDN
ncbi:MAG: High-affnity carbon uptake protein Hat/HatR [Ekhidna sp.]|nr:High-affnity carbon uptake protein Hat/HatR [Ekhidna sp.]MBC6426194.1 High-affnity carbon uptake protein Hat/HatR [Ekhidna sp.]